MFNLGWSELFLIAAITILAVGPKQLPDIMYGLGKLMRRITNLQFALSQQFDAFMADAEVSKSGKQDNDERDFDIVESDEPPPIKQLPKKAVNDE
ncbi:MAG: hypothetical protein GC136_07525 [Alphaproteobacteria bacterium]|nr:hypothetical protein [Alphaproteobacteria bacterium]